MPESRLAILSWPDYIAPQTLDEFTRLSGIEVSVQSVAGAVEMLDVVRAADGRFDILCPPDYLVRELISEGMLVPLNHARLPNLRSLDPRFLNHRPHDPQSRFSVIKDWGTTGFMYRTDMVTERPVSWADFWTLAGRYSGRVTVLDSEGEVIGAALKMRGYSYNSTDPHALAQARRDLLELRPHLLAFETNYRPLLAGGAACMALGWNGDAAALEGEGVSVEYVVPAEGSQIWEDSWAIPAATPHVEWAHAFLDFVLRPEIGAQEAMYTRYATGNREALAMLDESLRSNPAIYPPEEVLQKLEPGLPMDVQGANLRVELWKEVRGSF